MQLVFIVLNILLICYLTIRISLLEKALLKFVASQENKAIKKINVTNKSAAYMRSYRLRKKLEAQKEPQEKWFTSA